MQQGDGVYPDKRLEAFFPHRTIHKIVGVGTVEHHKLNAVFGTRLHDIVHRAYIRIETCAHILYVEHNDIQPVELLGCRLFVFTIDGDNRDAGLQVAAVFHLLSCVSRSSEAMLGCKHSSHIHALLHKCVQQMLLLFFQDGSLVDNQPDTFVFQETYNRIHALGTQNQPSLSHHHRRSDDKHHADKPKCKSENCLHTLSDLFCCCPAKVANKWHQTV